LRSEYDYRLGMTATLERDGDAGVDRLLLPFFGSKVFSYSYREAVPEGVVSPFALTLLGVDLDPEERRAHDLLSRRVSRARAVLGAVIPRSADAAEFNRRVNALAARGDRIGLTAREYLTATRARRQVLANCRAKLDAVQSLAPLIDSARGTVVFSQTITLAEEAARRLLEARSG
jgi:RNA polymerase primary sigma factor